MNDTTTWLGHSDLFNTHWIVETKSWVRNLGWFSEFQESVKECCGWAQYGNHELTTVDYVNIIDAKDAEKKLYKYHEGTWEHFSGPILFVVKKNAEETYIAGWAGPAKLITKLKQQSDNPWDWDGINLVEVNPFSVIVTFSKNRNTTLPVFFACNGETNAEENWQHLKKMCPRAVKLENIDGRRKMFLQAAHIADKQSHFFLVTGKNFVIDKTVFDYVPDSTVPTSHILFQAKNMSNRLEYGHMAIGCYNTDIVLSTPEDFGLDFTEYGKIYHIPRTVSEANFAMSEYEAWRTAFRECVKLTLKGNEITKKWLSRWTSFAEGEFSDWVLLGAEQGRDFALENKDDPAALKNTENWTWLQQYFHSRNDV